MELRAAWEGGDWPVMRAAAERIITARQEPTTRDFLALARACHRLKDFEAAAAAAARACERDRSNVEALMIAGSISRDRGDGDAALTYFRALGRRAPQNPRWAAEVIWLLILLGRISEAMSEVDASLARMPQQPLIWGLALEYGFRSFEQADAARTSVTNWEEFVRLIFRSPPD